MYGRGVSRMVPPMTKPLLFPIALALAASVLGVHSACVSSQEAPTVYGQGIVRPVRPPTFRPVDDAPHKTGQPGHVPGVRVAPEPQPKPTRLLPQTPETARQPGIWASKEPQAVPEMFRWDVPVPENDPEAAQKIHACASDMKVASAKTLTEYDLQVLDEASVLWRPCWPHSVVLYCLEDEKDRIGKFRPMDRIGQKHWDALERAIKRARQSWAEHCNAAPWLPPMEPRVIGTAKARGVK
jgi:hypothetical protein